MSTITFLHDVHSSSIKDGKKLTDEEKIIDGEKGLTIKYFHKDDSSTEKIVIMGKNDSFTMKTIINGDKDEKNLSRSELMKELKSKKLKFALDYFKGQEGGKITVKYASKLLATKNLFNEAFRSIFFIVSNMCCDSTLVSALLTV